MSIHSCPQSSADKNNTNINETTVSNKMFDFKNFVTVGLFEQLVNPNDSVGNSLYRQYNNNCCAEVLKLRRPSDRVSPLAFLNFNNVVITIIIIIILSIMKVLNHLRIINTSRPYFRITALR